MGLLSLNLSLSIDCGICGQIRSDKRRNTESIIACMYGFRDRAFCVGCHQEVPKETREKPEYQQKWDARVKEIEESHKMWGRFDPERHYLVLNRRPAETIRELIGKPDLALDDLRNVIVSALTHEQPFRDRPSSRPDTVRELRYEVTLFQGTLPLEIVVNLSRKAAPDEKKVVAFVWHAIGRSV